MTVAQIVVTTLVAYGSMRFFFLDYLECQALFLLGAGLFWVCLSIKGALESYGFLTIICGIVLPFLLPFLEGIFVNFLNNIWLVDVRAAKEQQLAKLLEEKAELEETVARMTQFLNLGAAFANGRADGADAE